MNRYPPPEDETSLEADHIGLERQTMTGTLWAVYDDDANVNHIVAKGLIDKLLALVFDSTKGHKTYSVQIHEALDPLECKFLAAITSRIHDPKSMQMVCRWTNQAKAAITSVRDRKAFGPPG